MAVLAKNLRTARSEINARWPDRDKRSDGWIGDRAHQGTVSDHNPDENDIVHAVDVDKDGIDPHFVVRRAIKHSSVQYVIYNETIWSRRRNFRPHRYTGSNKHRSHIHISGRHGSKYENNTTGWGIKPKPRPEPEPQPVSIPRVGNGTRMLLLKDPMMRGTDVRFVQRWIGKRRAGADDGIFGPHTRSGVMWYQRLRGIGVDGIVGPVTWRNMRQRWRG